MSNTGSRKEERSNVILTASVVDSRGIRTARISDLSSRGFLGRMDVPPQRGEFINLRFPGREVAGQVRWVNGPKFGVRLREQVDFESLRSGTGKRKAGRVLPQGNEQESDSLKNTIIAYGVMGVAAASTAYLLVTYIIL